MSRVTVGMAIARQLHGKHVKRFSLEDPKLTIDGLHAKCALHCVVSNLQTLYWLFTWKVLPFLRNSNFEQVHFPCNMSMAMNEKSSEI